MWLTAIILGAAGSLHCVGMCTPLVMAVTSLKGRAFVNRLLYNGGRIFTYAILGAIISLVGVMINFSQVQFFLTLAVALTLIIMGLSGITGARVPLVTPLMVRVSITIKRWFGTFIQKKGFAAMWVTGMLNGLLPCGLTYLALTYCLTLAGPLDGFQFMLLFGAGTLPAMLGLAGVLAWVVKKYRVNIATLTRYSFVIIGLLVLARLFFFQHHVLNHATDQGIIFCQ